MSYYPCSDCESLVKRVRHNAVLPLGRMLKNLQICFSSTPINLGQKFLYHRTWLFIKFSTYIEKHVNQIWEQSNQSKGLYKMEFLQVFIHDSIKLHGFMWFNENIEIELCKKLQSELIFCMKPKQLFLIDIFLNFLVRKSIWSYSQRHSHRLKEDKFRL